MITPPQTQDDFREFLAAIEVESATASRVEKRSAWTSYELDSMVSRYPSHLSLKEVIAAEFRDFHPSEDGDRAIWRDAEIVAVIRTGSNGRGQVVFIGTSLEGEPSTGRADR